MGISIRNPKAEQLAREVAEQSGESLTQAIIRALPELDQRSPDEILDYDNRGIPK